MHSLTIIGIVIIAVGTLIGTYCIQKGNQLKSRESSEKQMNEINNLKAILTEQNATLSVQNTTLATQETLLNEQLKIIKEKELENFRANRHEYDLLVRKFATVGAPMFQSTYSKELYFKLSHDEIITMMQNVNEAIMEIKMCKFASLSNYLAEDCWGRLSFDISGLLYNLSFKEGDKIKETTNGVTTIINVDRDYLDGQYRLLQNLLEEHQRKRQDEYQRMQKEVQRKYGVRI